MSRNDWANWSYAFMDNHPDAKCFSTEPAYCKFDVSCSSIPSDPSKISENLELSLPGFDFKVDYRDLLIEGSIVGFPDTKCIIGIFQMSKVGESEFTTQWFMGSALMDKYYWVFDSYKYPTSENP